MIYILYGPDSYSLHQTLETVKKSAGSEAASDSNIVELDGSQISLSGLKVACETVPFLADNRLVIITGLLERFEPKMRITSPKKMGGKIDQSQGWQLLANTLKTIPHTTILVLVDGEITNRNPLLKEIAAVAEVKPFPLLKRAALIMWIQKRVVQVGGKMSPPAVELIAKLVGNDLWAMANEIDKLVLYTGSRLIEEKDVLAIVSHAQETSVFTMVDAILENKTSIAEDSLQQLIERGAAPTHLLWMLHRQIRFIILVKELVKQKKTNMAIQAQLGLADYPMQKTLEQAEKYSLESLKSIYKKLLETDLAIKTGKYDGELALNILIAELCQS